MVRLFRHRRTKEAETDKLSLRLQWPASYSTVFRGQLLFLGLCITRHDRIENGEERWQTIGQIDGKYVILVAHIYPEIDEVRIISARRLLKKERKQYEECTNKKTARRIGRS